MLSFLFSKTPLSFFAQSLWRDEAFSYFLAKKNIFEIIFLTAKDFNPPLYYLLLHFWIKIFGGSEIALRSMSLIFYWGTIYFIFLFLKEILKIKEKLFLFLFLILFVVNPLLIYYAFEARMYTLLAFFSVFSSYAFLKENKKKYLFALIFGLLSHYFMIFIFLSQLKTFFIFKKKFKNFNLKLFVYPITIFAIWMVFVFFQKYELIAKNFWINKTNLIDIKYLPAIIFTGYEKGFSFVYERRGYLSLLLFLIILSNFFIKKEKTPEKKVVFFYLLLSGFITPIIIFIISFFKPIFLPRYLIGQSIVFLLLVIYSLNKINKKIFSLIILSILIYFSFDYQKLQIQFRRKSNYKKLYHEIKTLAKKDDLVYVTSELDYFTAGYYFDINRVKIFNKIYEKIPDYVGKILIPKEAITFSLPSYPKKAFIVENNSYSIQAVF